MTLLTIAVPCYNGSDNFTALFQSIEKLGLKTEEYEVLIVDNFSNDGTEELIGKFQSTMSNLRYHRNDHNIGRIENWNKAVELSCSEFLIVMNVNDRFLDFNAREHINYLLNHPEISLVLTDIEFKDSIYPNWEESGVINLKGYLRKTFLDDQYLEFHSVGVLHQHLFRTKLIKDHQLTFDPALPRTTDRVFVGELIAAGGGFFFYTNQSMVKWQLNANRYHYQVHIKEASFNFQELWVNEYEANLKLSKLGGITFEHFLKSQLILASSYNYKMQFREFKINWLTLKEEPIGLEFPTASVYLAYLCTIARLNKIPVRHLQIKLRGLLIVIKEFLIHHKFMIKPARTIKDIIENYNNNSFDSPKRQDESIIYNR
jgi:glycosyltransferase involved in cell wall biosynthesis